MIGRDRIRWSGSERGAGAGGCGAGKELRVGVTEIVVSVEHRLVTDGQTDGHTHDDS